MCLTFYVCVVQSVEEMLLPYTHAPGSRRVRCFLSGRVTRLFMKKPLHYAKMPAPGKREAWLAVAARVHHAGLFCRVHDLGPDAAEDADMHPRDHRGPAACSLALLDLVAVPFDQETVSVFQLDQHLTCGVFRRQVLEFLTGPATLRRRAGRRDVPVRGEPRMALPTSSPALTHDWCMGEGPAAYYSKRTWDALRVYLRHVQAHGLKAAAVAEPVEAAL